MTTAKKSNADNKLIPKTNTKPAMLASFLKTHLIKKDDTQKSTNTRIPDPATNSFGGKYFISPEKYSEFLDIYYKSVFVNRQKEHLTEVQLEKGPLLIDIDLRHEISVKTKQYTKEHIMDLIDLYLDIFKTIFQMDDETILQFYVFEKPTVNCIEDKKITKDGIHMIASISCDRVTQTIIRKKIIERIDEIWGAELNITNDWDSVFDSGISTGSTNWQLVGSCKPNHDAYCLTAIYNAKYDAMDSQFSTEYQDPATFDMAKNIFKLSARYPDHYEPFMSSDFAEECNRYQTGTNTKKKTQTQNANNMLVPANMNILSIRTRDELDLFLKTYLDNISLDKHTEYEAYLYVMTLPPDYYGSGSYSKWFAIGCALRNISNSLFIVWLVFSAQADNFDFKTIHELWDKWQKIDVRKNGLTLRSIMFWSKKDALDKYTAVRENSLDYYIEQTLDNQLAEFAVSDKKPSGATDYDIASVLYHLKKDNFVCISITGNIWFHFEKHRWKQIDSGTTLRMAISTELRNLYAKKAAKISESISNLSEDEDKTREYLGKRLEKVMEIYTKLGKTNDKKNIMTESKDLFYDPNFANSVDTNPYLMCFSNGVWDFKEKVFRDGKPEDYISKCCNVDYIPNGPKHTEIVAEIVDFMEKLFPIAELKEYMWDHLSSTLIGTAVNQTFNNYIGGGRNGKSVLVTLMSKVLGEYKGDLPLTAVVTPRRVGVGGLAPEIAALKGIRYAVMQEPKQGDILNEGILKELTSGFDTIQARVPYQPEPVRFIPQFKLIVCANVLPDIKAQDHGTWRRIRVVPFLSLFTENPVQGDQYKPYQYKIDPTIDEKFETWKTVFLAMLVDRALLTIGHVKDCKTVLEASNEYKHKQDVISQFIEERITRESGAGILKKTDVKNEFQIWHETNFGSRGPAPKEVYSYLDKIYGPQVNHGWRDVKIQRDDSEDAFIDDDEIDL